MLRLRLLPALAAVLLLLLPYFLTCLCLPDVATAAIGEGQSISTTEALSDNKPVGKCHNTVQGRDLLADNRGFVCSRREVSVSLGCCPGRGPPFACTGCNVTVQCCSVYEYCVSCCLHPDRTSVQVALSTFRANNQPSSQKYRSVFEYCRSRCRHNSGSVVHENAYLSDLHHCFSLLPPPPPPPPPEDENSLEGLTVVVAAAGQSCDAACFLVDHQNGGSQCNEGKLRVLNRCEVLQKYMGCKGGCVPSMGPDQPAEVLLSAPKNLLPGACLSNANTALFSCAGSHQFTRRLCPCSPLAQAAT